MPNLVLVALYLQFYSHDIPIYIYFLNLTILGRRFFVLVFAGWNIFKAQSNRVFWLIQLKHV